MHAYNRTRFIESEKITKSQTAPPTLKIAARSENHIELAQCSLTYTQKLSHQLIENIRAIEHSFDSLAFPPPSRVESVLSQLMDKNNSSLTKIRHPLGKLTHKESNPNFIENFT